MKSSQTKPGFATEIGKISACGLDLKTEKHASIPTRPVINKTETGENEIDVRRRLVKLRRAGIVVFILFFEFHGNPSHEPKNQP